MGCQWTWWQRMPSEHGAEDADEHGGADAEGLQDGDEEDAEDGEERWRARAGCRG